MNSNYEAGLGKHRPVSPELMMRWEDDERKASLRSMERHRFKERGKT